jgi:Rrf2 family protein
MFLSAKMEYACLALLELAGRYGSGKPIPLTDIAQKHGIPQRFLVQILLQLNGAGLVASTRGASGGYQLSRPPQQITLADISAAIERHEVPRERRVTPTPLVSTLHHTWRKVTAAQEKILSETTLEDLLTETTVSNYMI